MKIATLFFYLLLLLVFFIGCEEDHLNEPSTLKFSVEGKIVSNNFPDGISNIILSLKGIETSFDTTNGSGNYSFSNIQEGDYRLFINDVMFEEVDTLLTVNENIDLNLYLADKVSDYFPLEINNYWLFKLRTEDGDRSWTHDSFDGSEKWTVTNVKMTSTDKTYSLLLERNGVLTKIRTIDDNGNPVQVITKDTIEYFDSFKIIEDKNHMLSLNHEYIEQFSNRYRYYSSINDTLIKNDNEAWEVYRKEVGLIKGYYGWSSNGGINIKMFDLVEHN